MPISQDCRLKLRRYFATSLGKKYQDVEHRSFTTMLAKDPVATPIFKAILDFYGDVNKRKVLDVGCHVGYYSFLMAEKGAKVVGVEIDQERAGIAECLCKVRHLSSVKIVNKNIKDYLDHSTCTFDLTLFLNVFHHMLNVDEATAWRIMNKVSERTKTLVLMIDLNILYTRKQIKTQDDLAFLILQHSTFTRYKKLISTFERYKNRDLWAFWK